MDGLSTVGLTVALGLPWLCGAVWTHWLLRRSGHFNMPVVIGHGFFVGFFLTTLAMRLWDLAGLPLHFAGIAAALAFLTAIGQALPGSRLDPVCESPPPRSIPAWQWLAAALFIALIGWRHLTLLEELLLRPLYAWDAWMNWAPKAIVWFHHRALVDFVHPDIWLAQGAVDVYTLGNRQASTYPVTVPLIQLWGMLGAGSWDHGAVYLPWLLAPIALGLALFGHLRLAGVPFLAAVIACYLLLSLPLLNVHTALAGYADLWVAAAFGLGVCALHAWRQCGHPAHAVLLLWLALLCSQLKQPGLVLALILLACAAGRWLTVRAGLAIAALAVAAALIGLVLLAGDGVDIPGFGRVALDGAALEIGRFGRFEPAFRNVAGAFVESLFVMLNWNLLWYLLCAFLLVGLARVRRLSVPPAEGLAALAALVFVCGVFFLERYANEALRFVTVNRALLYPVPALLFCAFLAFRQAPPAEQ